jgi:hypothetical protein
MKPVVVVFGSVALTGAADDELDVKSAIRRAVEEYLAENEVLDTFQWADAPGIPSRYWERAGIRYPTMVSVVLVDSAEVLQEAEERPIPTAPPKETGDAMV